MLPCVLVTLFSIWCIWEYRAVADRSKEEPASWAKEMMGTCCCCFSLLVYPNIHMLPYECFTTTTKDTQVSLLQVLHFLLLFQKNIQQKKQVMTAWPFCDYPDGHLSLEVDVEEDEERAGFRLTYSLDFRNVICWVFPTCKDNSSDQHELAKCAWKKR